MGIYMFPPLVAFLSGFELRDVLRRHRHFYGEAWAAMVHCPVDRRAPDQRHVPRGQGNMLIQELTQSRQWVNTAGYKRMILNILLLTLFIGLPADLDSDDDMDRVNIGGG